MIMKDKKDGRYAKDENDEKKRYPKVGNTSDSAPA